MKSQDTIYWKYVKAITLTILAFTFMTLPGQSIGPVLAQEDTPFLFIENMGQFSDEQIRFQVNMGQATLRLADDALWFTIIENPPVDQQAETQAENDSGELKIPAHQGVNLKLSFVEANPQPRLEPFNPQDTNISYFTGSDPAKWQTNVPVWGGVRYVELYPGVDLEVTSENGQLVQRLVVHESDVAVSQAGNPLDKIQWQVEGADSVTVEEGQLHLSTALGEFTLPLLQVVNGENHPAELSAAQAEVDGSIVTAPFTSAFEAEVSGTSSSLVAAGASDLLYSTFLGGEGDFDNGYGITFDAAGNAYVTGQADPGFPSTPGVFDTSIEGVFNDVFVVKLTPDGSDLVFATFVGGSDWEISEGIHVDESGNPTIAGHTTSTDFPTTPGAFDSTMTGPSDAYVVKLNSTGTELIYSTLFGGNDNDFVWDMAVDEAGYAYMTGTTNSTDFPITPGAYDDSYEATEGYVVKVSLDGSELIYATYLGGNSWESGYGIAVDELGSAYVVGRTDSPDFPLPPDAMDLTFSNIEGYAVKLMPDGTDLVYGTFIGGSEYDNVEAIDVDAEGNAYLTGSTRSADFPTTPDAFAPTCSDCSAVMWLEDAFVTKLAPDGRTLVYSSFLGGDQPDFGLDIAVSEAGSAYVTGFTYSPDFPVTPDAFDTICESCSAEPINHADAFVARVNPGGTAIAYATFLGGGDIVDLGTALDVDDGGNVYVTGSTDALDFPITGGAYDPVHEGFYDVFVAKLATGSDEPEPEPTPTPIPVPEHTCAPTYLGDISVGDAPRGLDVDPARNRVYVANSNSVSVIDSSTNTVWQTISNIEDATDVAYDSTNNIIWVTNFGPDTVTPIQANENATSFTVLPAISVGDGPWGVAYNPVNNAVYVVNNLAESVSMLDATTMEVVATITEPFYSPWHLVVNSVTGKVYVANSGHNSVTVINGAAVSSEAQLWDSGSGYGIAVDETRDTVYVATIQSHRIVAIGWLNGQPDQFLGWASFQRGYNPNRPIPLRAIAINPQKGPAFDGGHLWATTATIDGSEANQALFIPKGWSSRFHVPFAQNLGEQPSEGIAVDRVHNRVYFTSGVTPGTVTVIGDHDNICGGIAPASVKDGSDEIGLEVYSVAEVLLSDVNDDGLVDIFDLAFLAARYDSNDSAADLNQDGVVDIFDLALMAGYYGQTLPQSAQP